MSEEKKTAATEEVKKEARKLTEEELEQVTGGSGYVTQNLELPEVKPAPI